MQNSRHPSSSARGVGSGPPRRVPDSVATVATVATVAAGAAPSGNHFRTPLSRMWPFAGTAERSDMYFRTPLSRMRSFALAAERSETHFRAPLSRIRPFAVTAKKSETHFGITLPHLGATMPTMRPIRIVAPPSLYAALRFDGGGFAAALRSEFYALLSTMRPLRCDVVPSRSL